MFVLVGVLVCVLMYLFMSERRGGGWESSQSQLVPLQILDDVSSSSD